MVIPTYFEISLEDLRKLCGEKVVMFIKIWWARRLLFGKFINKKICLVFTRGKSRKV